MSPLGLWTAFCALVVCGANLRCCLRYGPTMTDPYGRVTTVCVMPVPCLGGPGNSNRPVGNPPGTWVTSWGNGSPNYPGYPGYPYQQSGLGGTSLGQANQQQAAGQTSGQGTSSFVPARVRGGSSAQDGGPEISPAVVVAGRRPVKVEDVAPDSLIQAGPNCELGTTGNCEVRFD